MSDRGLFGGTEDAVPSARDLAGVVERREPQPPVESPTPPRQPPADAAIVDDEEDKGPGIPLQGRYYNATRHNTSAPPPEEDLLGRPKDDVVSEPIDSMLLSGPPRDHARTETHFCTPRPAVRRPEPASDPAAPTTWPVLDADAVDDPLGGLLPPDAARNLPAVPTSVAPRAAPTPVPIDCGPIEWRGQQALRGALGLFVGSLILPALWVSPPPGIMLVALLFMLVGLVLGTLMLRPAVAPSATVTAGVETLRVDAGWASFELPWNEIESVIVGQRELRSRYHTTDTAFLEVRLNRHSRVMQRHRGAWIYHCARPRVLEVPISTRVVGALEQELDSFAGPAKLYKG